MFKLIASILSTLGFTYLATRKFYENQIIQIEAANKAEQIKKVWEFHDMGYEAGKVVGALQMSHELWLKDNPKE